MPLEPIAIKGPNGNIPLPQKYVLGVTSERGDAGSSWLRALPALVQTYCDKWNLTLDGSLMHGYIGLVVPVHHAEEAYVLKVSWIDDETKDEAMALRSWGGNGAVKLIRSDDKAGVMLLESLSETALSSVPVDEAVTIAASLLRRLAIPAPSGMLRLPEYIASLGRLMDERWERLGQPFAKKYLTTVHDEISRLASSSVSLIANQDLHYDNILVGSREPWLVIDPKVVAGDPEFGVAPLLWRRPDHADNPAGLSKRFAQIVHVARLDEDRAYGWTLIRTVEYWLLALNLGLTHDLARCELITTWIMASHYPS